MQKIHMIGSTHFDPVWLWRWDEGLASVRATFRAALERMNEDPDFIYSFSAPAVLSMIEKTDPDLFAEIRARVEEGRWELCEGWWLQPDCMSAGGESYVRQGLYAQLYHQEKFGKRSETVFNVDSFGHAASLPQILAGCGIKNYAFWRPDEQAFHLPAPFFTWRGIDGSEVTAMRTENCHPPKLEEEALLPLLDHPGKQKNAHIIFGVTDHGGAPTKKDIATIRAYRDRGVWFDRVDRTFADAREEDLPAVTGELPVRFPGPSLNMTEIKKNNRLAEEKLLRAETAAVMAWYLCGREYPRTLLREAWEDVLFNQFHDILGGTCIPSAYFDARNLHGRAMQTADEITHFSLQNITSRIAMPGKNPDNPWNLAVFNTNGADGETYVEAEVQWAWEYDWYKDGLALLTPDGDEIPVQIVREECVLPGFRSRFVFRTDLPACGYRTFALVKKEEKPAFPAKNSRTSVSLGGWRMTAEKHGGVTLRTPGGKKYEHLFTPYLRTDFCDTWGFNENTFGKEKIAFTRKECAVTEEGFLRCALRTVCTYASSRIEQTFLLTADGSVECRYRVLFAEKNFALQLAFPATAPTVTSAIPYGFTERAASYYEKAAGTWLTAGEAGVTADAVFGYDFDGKNVGLSLLRAAIYGDLRQEPLEDRPDYAYLGQGETTGTLRAFFGSPTLAQMAREAQKLLRPATVVDEACHEGELPPEMTVLYADGDNILPTACKLAEDGDRIVLRTVETAGVATRATVKLFDRAKRYDYRPYEIKTTCNTEECNMLEEKETAETADVEETGEK